MLSVAESIISDIILNKSTVLTLPLFSLMCSDTDIFVYFGIYYFNLDVQFNSCLVCSV